MEKILLTFIVGIFLIGFISAFPDQVSPNYINELKNDNVWNNQCLLESEGMTSFKSTIKEKSYQIDLLCLVLKTNDKVEKIKSNDQVILELQTKVTNLENRIVELEKIIYKNATKVDTKTYTQTKRWWEFFI